MSATLHLARYSPRCAARMLRQMRRGRVERDRSPGLVAGRLWLTTELEPVTGGRPTPTRWAFFSAWDDREARDAFFSEPSLLTPFFEHAREAWSVALDPVRVVNGKWRGWRPSTDDVEPLAHDEPLAVITYGRLRTRYIPTFIWNNRKAVRQIDGNPGLLSRIGLSDGVNIASTFSLWRSQGDVVRYAYGPGDHKPIQRRSLDVPWGTDYFFARFRPVASRGEWNGRDPLAGLIRERVAAG